MEDKVLLQDGELVGRGLVGIGWDELYSKSLGQRSITERNTCQAAGSSK